MESLHWQVKRLQKDLDKLEPMLQNKSLGFSEPWVKESELENTLTNVFCKIKRLQRDIEHEFNK